MKSSFRPIVFGALWIVVGIPCVLLNDRHAKQLGVVCLWVGALIILGSLADSLLRNRKK